MRDKIRNAVEAAPFMATSGKRFIAACIDTGCQLVFFFSAYHLLKFYIDEGYKNKVLLVITSLIIYYPIMMAYKHSYYLLRPFNLLTKDEKEYVNTLGAGLFKQKKKLNITPGEAIARIRTFNINHGTLNLSHSEYIQNQEVLRNGHKKHERIRFYLSRFPLIVIVIFIFIFTREKTILEFLQTTDLKYFLYAVAACIIWYWSFLTGKPWNTIWDRLTGQSYIDLNKLQAAGHL